MVVVNPWSDRADAAPEAALDALPALTAWADCLAGAGIDVVVVQAHGRDAVLERGGTQYRLVAVPARRRPRPWWAPGRLVAHATSVGPDVVHLNGLLFSLLAARLRRRLPAESALVIQHHAEGPSRRLSWLQRRALGGADGFLFTGRDTATPFLVAGVIRPTQPVFEVMEVPVTAEPGPRSADQPRLAGEPSLLWVGHLDPNKDPLTVLDAFEQTSEALPEARLHMVFLSALLHRRVQERIAAAPALASRVRLVGAVDHADIWSLYRSADLFVLGSHREGSGLALAEAMACGVVPVVTSIPPFRWMTADGAVGGLWQPGDSGACAARILRAAETLSPTSRRAVRSVFEQRLSARAVARDAGEAYRVAVARRPGRPRPR